MRRKARRDLSAEERLARGPMDLPFLALVVLLTAVGLVVLLSASYASAYYNTDAGVDTGGNPYYYFIRQLGFALLGFAAMYIVSRIDYQRLRLLSVVALAVAIVLMLLVFTPLGRSSNGARRWLNLGISFQPSELLKVAVVMFFAARLSKRGDELSRPVRNWNRRTLLGRVGSFLDDRDFFELVPYIIILGIVALLMAKQPHMSGLLIIMVTAASILFASGISLGWFGAALGVGAAGVVGIISVNKYMQSRLLSWLAGSGQDTQNTGYQLHQSQVAIGSGGLLGLGLGNSRQKFLYLPEEHNDFIFAIVCEELGLVGACLIMFLFALLIIRGYWLAIHARDRFGTLLIVGITTMFAAQILFNIGVVTGVLPTTGISLPFFSYGGTALFIQLAAMGIVLSVSRQIPAPKAE